MKSPSRNAFTNRPLTPIFRFLSAYVTPTFTLHINFLLSPPRVSSLAARPTIKVIGVYILPQRKLLFPVMSTSLLSQLSLCHHLTQLHMTSLAPLATGPPLPPPNITTGVHSPTTHNPTSPTTPSLMGHQPPTPTATTTTAHTTPTFETQTPSPPPPPPPRRVTHSQRGIYKPIKKLNLDVTTTSPIPYSHIV